MDHPVAGSNVKEHNVGTAILGLYLDKFVPSCSYLVAPRSLEAGDARGDVPPLDGGAGHDVPEEDLGEGGLVPQKLGQLGLRQLFEGQIGWRKEGERT